MSEITEKVITDRIKALEADIEKTNTQIGRATQIRISMQGGIIELKKLLERFKEKECCGDIQEEKK